MIRFDAHPAGILIPVRAQPRARSARIVGEHAGALKVAVTHPPERGKANEAIATLLAELFGLKPSQVQLISGATSRNKRFLLVNQQPGTIQMCIDRMIARGER